MKRVILIYICAFFLISCSRDHYQAEKVKKVNESTTVGLSKKNVVYFVLKSDTSKKHGIYKETIAGKEHIIGYYKNGVKDSVWTEYYKFSNNVNSRGSYFKNNKVGEWKFYNRDNTHIQTYNYSTGLITYHKGDSNISGNVTIRDSDFTSELAYNYVGGSNELEKNIYNTIKVSEHKNYDCQITQKLSYVFELNENGEIQNLHIDKIDDKSCEDYYLNIVKEIPNKWKQINDKKVIYPYEINVTINLSFY